MFYLLAVSTGFRHNELASLTLGQLHLDAEPTPYLTLDSADTKNAREAMLPLRPDVVEKLREYLADYPARFTHQADCDSNGNNRKHSTGEHSANRGVSREHSAGGHSGSRGASHDNSRNLKLDAKLFDSPPTIRIFDADIQAAGIAKKDARGRVADIHALRHTFGTHLSAAGVHPRTTMAAMRHSRIELTMNLYTDPILLDVAGAVNALPNFIAKPAAKSTTGIGTATPPAD